MKRFSSKKPKKRRKNNFSLRKKSVPISIVNWNFREPCLGFTSEDLWAQFSKWNFTSEDFLAQFPEWNSNAPCLGQTTQQTTQQAPHPKMDDPEHFVRCANSTRQLDNYYDMTMHPFPWEEYISDDILQFSGPHEIAKAFDSDDFINC
ncbi:MAG: hypothetical protein Satyrvirus2_69 [Satyrvirus sp.]|uniref:Uncharacterized protein n=1 Tax=Satyrvirus sp. TaxID=2487771 RepID=A0A3G5ACV2_9VIRU|nr:MAG: hypothetical protein Satyrvirus2_69 [Satyrvirus sp.]